MKRFIGILFVLVIISTAALLFACSSDTPTEDEPSTPIDNAYDNGFFDLSDIKFRKTGEINTLELLDEIPFDKIKLTGVSDSAKNYFSVFFDGELVVSYKYNKEKKSYGSHVFDKEGSYYVLVQSLTDAKTTQGRFFVDVSAAAVPTSAAITVTNSAGQTVTNVTCGDTYTLTAKLLCKNVPLTDSDFSGYWSAQEGDSFTTELTLPDSQNDYSLDKHFTYFVVNNEGNKQSATETFTINVKNNLLTSETETDGLYVTFGERFSSGAAVYPINMSFINDISFQYRYASGNSFDLRYSNDRSANSYCYFIKYDGESEFSLYNAEKYDYTFDNDTFVANYYANGATYYFDPTKNSAEIYASMCYLEQGEYKYEKIAGSDAVIDIQKIAPTSITVASISGAERTLGETGKTYTNIKNREVVNNCVTVKVVASVDTTATVDHSRQHFSLNVTTNGECNLTDYEILVSSEQLIKPVTIYGRYNKATLDLAQYLYAPVTGVAQVTVKSKFSDVSTTVTVTVENPVLYAAMAEPGMVAGVIPSYFKDYVDISAYLRINVFRYSFTKDQSETVFLSDYTDLFNVEIYKYGDDFGGSATTVTPQQLTYENMGKKGYFLQYNLIQKSTARVTAKNSVRRQLFVVPPVSFSVCGESYSSVDLTESILYLNPTSVQTNDFRFIGNVPTLTVINDEDKPLDFSIIGDGDFRYVIDGTVINIYYDGFTPDGVAREGVLAARVFVLPSLPIS